MLRMIVLAAALAAGCYAGEIEYSGGVGPDLVDVSPGVRVIADYDEPIFFADEMYWWFYDGLWYRSATYTGGWIFVPTPPLVVLNIREPFRWVHYHPRGFVAHHAPVPAHRVQRPPHHTPRAQGPHIRDHRH